MERCLDMMLEESLNSYSENNEEANIQEFNQISFEIPIIDDMDFSIKEEQGEDEEDNLLFEKKVNFVIQIRDLLKENEKIKQENSRIKDEILNIRQESEFADFNLINIRQDFEEGRIENIKVTYIFKFFLLINFFLVESRSSVHCNGK